MSTGIRFLVHFVFLYTCVEGFIVNLTYPSVVAYLVKDVVLMFIYVAMVTEQRPSAGSIKRIGGALFVYCAVMAFFLIMPTRVSLLSALVGLKQRLFYIPLIYIAYFYMRTEQDLFRLIKILTWCAIPTAGFGIFLYFAGPQALRAMGGNYSAIHYTISGASGISAWRVPGTFTSPGQFGMYLLMQAVLMTGILFVPTVPKRTRLVVMIATVVTLGAMLVSGSRAPLVIYILCIGVGLAAMGRLGRIGMAALALYIAGTVAFTYFGGGVEDRVGSILSEENYQRVRSTAFGQLFYERMLDEPLGVGLGSATIAGRHFTNFAQIVFVESYFGVIAVETGVFGFIALVFLLVQVMFLLFRDRRMMRRVAVGPIWFFIVVVVFEVIALMPAAAMIDSAPGNLYFWFMIGLAVRMADLARAQAAAPSAANASQPGVAPPVAFHSPWSAYR
jgi:hypothetical protein